MKGNYVAKYAKQFNKGGAHRSKKDYKRKPKHPKRDNW